MTGLTGLTVWGETVKKVKTVITKNHMTKLCGERGVAKPIGHADSVYTISALARWASSVLERRAIILP